MIQLKQVEFSNTKKLEIIKDEVLEYIKEKEPDKEFYFLKTKGLIDPNNYYFSYKIYSNFINYYIYASGENFISMDGVTHCTILKRIKNIKDILK